MGAQIAQSQDGKEKTSFGRRYCL